MTPPTSTAAARGEGAAPAQPGPPDAYGFETLGAVSRVERVGDATVVLHAGGARLRLDFPDEAIVRVRLAAPGGDFAPDETYAMDPAPAFRPTASLEVVVGDDEVRLRTPSLSVRARRDTCRLRFEDREGYPIVEDEAGAAWGAAGAAALSLRLRPDERIFGLGDKPSALDRRGRRYENWATDAFGFQRDSDPLYKAIPVIVGIVEGRPWGLFVDTTRRSAFDLGAEDAGRLRVDTGGSPLDYVVVAGTTPLDVVRGLARYTGRTPMLPRWALGYHQCRYSYRDEAEVRTVARELRERGFGCDAIYFDIHYMDGFRVFTWDREAFPDPAGLIGDLAADGFRSVVIIDPGVKADDPEYAVAHEGLEAGHYCTYPDGQPFVGEVWPGPCYFPDFTRAGTRMWWGDLHRGLVADGAAGVWNDMNEPAVFTVSGVEADAGTFPLEVRHDLDGRGGDHAEAHNVYGMQMARATTDGLRRLAPARRPFIITRAAYAGTQRYATTWTGDNSATWDHLRLAAQQCLSLAISGIPFSGSDVGGFSGAPDGELFARWMQLGVLTPLFRNHSAVDTPRREPWLFGDEIESVARGAVALRYRLLPYLYTALHEAATDGTPILRALPLVHPADETVRRASPLAFYVGPDLLAHPVLEEGQREREVYLPAREGGWTCFHTGAHHPGRSSVWAETPLDRLPLYVGAGTVLPLAPARRHADEPFDRLTLRVYAGPARWSSRMYDDAGDGWDFENGDYWLASFNAEDDGAALVVACEVEGRRPAPAADWDVVLPGVTAASVLVDGADAPFEVSHGGTRVATGPFRSLRVERV